MPVVSTKTVFVPIESGDKEERKIKINFNQQVGGFYIKLDNLWVFYLTQDEKNDLRIRHEKRWAFNDFLMIDNDFDKLINRFEVFLQKATEKIRTVKREKILIVTFEVDSVKETHHKDDSYSRESFSSEQKYSWQESDQTQMCFNYKVGYRCGDVLFDEEMQTLSGYSYKYATIIGWTAERQIFFYNVLNGFHELIWKIDEFLKMIKKEPKKLDESIKGEIKLLPVKEVLKKEKK